MSELDPGLVLAGTNILSAGLAWLVKAWRTKQEVQDATKKELTTIGLDLIDELRQEITTGRVERQRLLKENEEMRSQSWQWKHMHTDLMMKNQYLAAKVTEQDARNTRLEGDIDRYRQELNTTKDIRPPDDDVTGPNKAVRKRS